MSPARPVMSPLMGLPVISPARLMLVGLPVMSPARAAEEIARVKREAQRIDLKLFNLILLSYQPFSSVGQLGGGMPLQMSILASTRFQCSALLFQGSCHSHAGTRMRCKY